VDENTGPDDGCYAQAMQRRLQQAKFQADLDTVLMNTECH